MNWFRRRWHRWRYRHPSIHFERLDREQRREAVELVRKMFDEHRKQPRASKKPLEFKPTLHQIALTQLSVCLNASLLTAEARWLRFRRYYSRAFVLAKLAQEEFGKVYLLDQAALLTVADAGDHAWHDFWRSWRDHKSKSYLTKLPFAPNGFSKGRIDYEERTKNAALYVEFWENGISVPAMVVTREMADEMIEICDWSEIHAFAKVRDLPLIDDRTDRNGVGLGVEALLSTFYTVHKLPAETAGKLR